MSYYREKDLLQLCKWDDYHVFLIATLLFTRLLLDEIYHLIELPLDWVNDDTMFVCLLDVLVLCFCNSDLTWETGGIELGSTITLVLQANRLTKCASSLYNFVRRGIYILEKAKSTVRNQTVGFKRWSASFLKRKTRECNIALYKKNKDRW